jgi:hypothetical protein
LDVAFASQYGYSITKAWSRSGISHSEDFKQARTKLANIRMDLREIRWEGVDWMHLAQDRDQ